MATSKLFNTFCGFDDDLLISQTPMICRLLLKSQCISHKNESVKKWLSQLTKLLEQEQKNKECNKIWSFLCLLSATYKVINGGYLEWNKHCKIILNLLEDSNIFNHLILRKRCFQTLCQIIKYSQFIYNANCHQLSSQISSRFVLFLQNILQEIVLKQNNNYNDPKLLKIALITLHKMLSNINLNSYSKIDTKIINKSCLYCLISNDDKIRLIAVGMFFIYKLLFDESLINIINE